MSKQTKIDDCFNATGPDWQEQAWKLTLRFISLVRSSGEKWTTEDLRRYCRDRNLEERDGRAFGSILQTLSRNGVIRKVGLRETANTKAHSRLVRVWRVA